MRIAVVFVTLPLVACAGAYHTPSDGRLNSKINTAYAERDACLARHAATDSAAEAGAAASAVAVACTEETEKLVEIVNRDGDPRITTAIRQDTEFRARGYVLRARGQITN